MAIYFHVFAFRSDAQALLEFEGTTIDMMGTPPGTRKRIEDTSTPLGTVVGVDCKFRNEDGDPLVFIPGPAFDVDDPTDITLPIEWQRVKEAADDWVLLRVTL